MRDVCGKRILVIGAARSGVAATQYLQKKGAEVTLTDGKPLENFGEDVRSLEKMGVRLVFGRPPEIIRGSFHEAVISPGIPLTIPLVQDIREKGIPLIGEMELAFRESAAPYIAITGTNGKTTTTALTGQIFKESGRPVFVGGNIGKPLISAVEELTSSHVVVAEVSSFQLETVETFSPRVAVILNITPDHLDRHGSMEGYTAAKSRVFENQKTGDYTVLNFDDLRVRALADQTPGRVIFFSHRTYLKEGVSVRNGQIEINLDGNSFPVVNCDDIFIKGKHNLENALAATAAAFSMGISPAAIGRTLRQFPGVAHRLEFVKEVDGVAYVNDSKGTNPDSTIKALEAYDRPIILIAGGRNKGSDFRQLAALIKEKVRTLVLVGEAAGQLRQVMEETDFDQIVEAKDFPETVKLARQAARKGDVVLLSPACASWDMFRDYEERGDLFKELVMKIAKE